MTEKNPDNPFPESDDNPSFADVSSQEDENDVTVILPEELTEDVGSELTEEVMGPDPSAKTGEVFVLLPDGDDSQIPMVETQEVPEITEEIDGPRLSSVYESSTSATQVGLRRENPVDQDAYAADTELDPYGEPTEQCMVTDHPTETMSAGDLDDFANEVADDMLADGGAPGMEQAPVGYEDDDGFDDEEPYYEDEATYAPGRRKKGSPFKKLVLSLVALIAIAATGVHFFPQHLGLDPSFDLTKFVMGHVNSLIGGPDVASAGGSDGSPSGGGDPDGTDGTPTPPPLAVAARETFKSRFKEAIELGFGEVPRCRGTKEKSQCT